MASRHSRRCIGLPDRVEIDSKEVARAFSKECGETTAMDLPCSECSKIPRRLRELEDLARLEFSLYMRASSSIYSLVDLSLKYHIPKKAQMLTRNIANFVFFFHQVATVACSYAQNLPQTTVLRHSSSQFPHARGGRHGSYRITEPLDTAQRRHLSCATSNEMS
jgi:hypothetical protein